MRTVFTRFDRFISAAFALVLPFTLHAGNTASPAFVETVVVSGLNEPVSIAWAPDASRRLFVTEKSAGIRVIQNGVLLATPFATFPQLYSQGECGVLGLCFDPNYAANHYVYVFVTVSESSQRIVRFTDVGNVGAERTNIVSGLPTLGANHNGGALAFGHDGKIYWAVGDNGSKRGVDGDLTSLAAKVGRANADGSVPIDNPFNDGAGPNNDYIWATGFRNPFTMTFQPRTGKLWLNVVGSNAEGQTEPNSGPGYEQVFTLNAGDDGGYDDYEGNQPNGSRYTTPFVRPFAHPVLQYKTSNADEADLARDISGITRSGGVAAITTTAAHPFRVGQAVRIAGASDATFNGILCVLAVPGANTFTVTNPGADATATGGTAQPFVIGSSISGGVFYESSAFPAEYRGNFFFADYTGGNVMRAVFNAQNQLTALSVFSTEAGSPVDVALGPDGALYVADIGGGNIRRIAAAPPAKVIVTPSVFNMREGGQAAFAVRLGTAPAGTVRVTTHRISSDEDEAVAAGETLTFTPANWNVPQAVTVAALIDSDSSDDHATFLVSAPGIGSETVNVSVTDTSANAPLLSANALTIGEGTSASFLVSLPQQPARPVTLYVRRVSGTAARVVEGAALVFTPASFSSKRVTIFANQDADALNGLARFTVGGAGYTARGVSVAVLDNETRPPVFGGEPLTRAVVGLPYQYAARAAGQPAPFYDLLAAPAGMTINSATGMIDWTPSATGLFSVTVRANNGLKPAARRSFQINVAADQPPTLTLIAPIDGSTISGANAEFFGTSSDDYGCYKAEFFVDNALIYTGLNRVNHYHAGGAHQLFNTTAFSNGTHTLKMIVFDDHNQSATKTVQVTIAN